MARERVAQPKGTVTFLFTDVEGSTALWDRRPDSMRTALERHDDILREAIAAHGGCVFSTAGDSFSVAFWTAAEAISAAIDAQLQLAGTAWPDGAALRVRMGVHLGAAQERNGDYFGAAVNRAARLMALAHGGQVLVSLAVEQVIRDGLPAGVSLTSLGEHTLRGLSRPETVYQLGAPGLHARFPPLRALEAVAGNLPSPSTSFIGRVDELKRLAAALASRRLITLVGPGGVGKTRLAIETAAAVPEEFPDGTWLVELAPVADPRAVLHAVASTLRLPPIPGSTMVESIVDGLMSRRLLLVLDNCEQVIDAAADLASAIGRSAPTVTILATSREALGAPGEQLWQVEPLDPRLEAVDLFVERARAIDVDFAPDDAALAAMGELCEHLDGIPLAIELAASRTRSMSVADLTSRLGDRFRLLRRPAGGDAGDRQQTLLATIEWSYRLLTRPQQLLFERLSVFAGGFDLPAAEAVCAFAGVDEIDVVDLLDALVNRSMVHVDRSGGEFTFRLLETLRQYGQDRLIVTGQANELRSRHVDHYMRVGGRAREQFEGTANAAGRALFERSWDNLRAALEHAEASGEDAAAGQIVHDSFWYAWFYAKVEHRRWMLRRVDRLDRDDPVTLGRAAFWAVLLGAYDETETLARRAITTAASPEHPDVALAWTAMSWAAWYTGRAEAAREADEAGKRAAESGTDLFSACVAKLWIHPTVTFQPERAPARAAAAHALVAQLNNDPLEASIALHTGHAWFGVGDYARALGHWTRAKEIGRRAGLTGAEGYALAALATRSAQLGGDDPAPLFRESIGRLHALGLKAFTGWALIGLAGWWADHEQIEPAAHVIGFLDANEPGGNQTYAAVRNQASDTVQRAPNAGPWISAGGRMTRDEIVVYCLERLSPRR